MDKKRLIVDLTAGYLRSRLRQQSTGSVGVDEYVNRMLQPDLEVITSLESLPEEKITAIDRVILAGLFEESLFTDFPGLRPK